MSDLISREALLKAHQDLVAFGTDTTFAVRNLITNAPAVSGEAVLYAFDGYDVALQIHNGATLCTAKPTDFHKLPLYTSPQQPQSVADALEEAAKICDGYHWIPYANPYDCAKEIRTLIKRNAGEVNDMDIVDRLRAMGGYLDYDCEVPLSFIADEIQTLRAKVASAEVLVEALCEIRETLQKENDNENGAIQDTIWHTPHETLFDFIDEALANYDKQSEVKHDTE